MPWITDELTKVSLAFRKQHTTSILILIAALMTAPLMGICDQNQDANSGTPFQLMLRFDPISKNIDLTVRNVTSAPLSIRSESLRNPQFSGSIWEENALYGWGGPIGSGPFLKDKLRKSQTEILSAGQVLKFTYNIRDWLRGLEGRKLSDHPHAVFTFRISVPSLIADPNEFTDGIKYIDTTLELGEVSTLLSSESR